MRDTVSISRVQLLHPEVRNIVKAKIEEIEAGWPITMAIRTVQTLRTIEEQNNIYALGRTVKNPNGASPNKPLGDIVSKAKGGSSFHNYGLAFDFAILYDKDNNSSYETLSWDMSLDFNNNHQSNWMDVVNAFKSIGWEWGGDWHSIKDNPHLEKRFGYMENCSDLYQKYLKKDFIKGTNYINL